MTRSCDACGAELPPDSPTCRACGGAASTMIALQRDVVARESSQRRGRRGVLVAATALVAAGVGAGAVYAGTALGGGGTQPQDVLPQEAVGFLSIDLDPAAGQKIAAYRLAQKFPDSGVSAEEDVKDDLLRTLLADSDEVDYDADLAPWLGDRAGVAFLAPDLETPDEPVVIAAVQVTDRAQAEQGLARLAEQAGDEPLHWAFSADEDYVLLSDDQATVDSAAQSEAHLSDNPRFVEGVEALEGDHIGLGWMDLGAVYDAVPDEGKQDVLASQPDFAPEGLLVLGARVEDDGVEVVGMSVGVSLGGSPELQALSDDIWTKNEPSGLIEDLPADSLGAFSITGLGDGLAQLYTTFEDDMREDLDALQPTLDEFGVRLPDDLPAVLGGELAVAVGGDFDAGGARVLVHVESEDGARAVELVQRAIDSVPEVPPGLAVTTVDGGYTMTYDPAGQGASSGRLGDSDLFRRTVPDAADSRVTYYADITRLVEQAGTDGLTDTERRNLEPLKAAGYTATLDGEGNGTFRLRVTVE